MTPIERILTALTNHDCNPKQNSTGWSAHCPAHGDQHPSLSISQGDDGRVLLHCKAGCPTEDVVRAIDLSMPDLFSDDRSTPSTSTKPRQTPRNGQFRRRRQANGKRNGTTYATANEAVTVLNGVMAKENGKCAAHWTYHNVAGDPVAVVVRYNLPTPVGQKTKKTFRPVARHGDRWNIGGIPEPRPLYGLPGLADAGRVYITEGEKSADAARRIGLTATTSAHGSQSPGKTDWTPLAGKECVILPDNDEAGQKYVNSVTLILTNLTPPAMVKSVELPGLPDQGDVKDWVEARPNFNADELRKEMESLADASEVIQPDRPEVRTERFQSFPTNVLPEPICGFVEAGAKAIGCDSSFLALPLLSALAAAIGNTRRIQIKRGWSAPAIIWTAIVGESGTAKTPAFKLVMRPIRERQQMALARHAEEMKEHEANLLHYDAELTDWKRTGRKNDEPPPEKPDAPQAERYIVNDVTVESLAPLLLANPRGLLLARDELAGWLGSFDRYAGGKGADSAHWLSLHTGESICVDRKTGKPPTIYVPQALISITGGIQPTILNRALGTEHRESGLAARLLLACPPRKAKRWTEDDIDPELDAEIARLFDRLYTLETTVDDKGNSRPVVVAMTSDAKGVWKQYFNSHADEQADLTGELSAAWSKLEEYAPRLALVIHFVRCAADDSTLESPDVVDATSMSAGIELAQWFKGEARRVYSRLSESDEAGDQRQLAEWIQRKGGSVTARQVQQGHRQYRTSGDAVAVLDDLAKANFGDWQEAPPSSKGGRPTRIFRLHVESTVYETPVKPEADTGFVDVDSVDNVHFKSERVDWETPQDFFDDVNNEFGFDLDVCASPVNAKCSRFFTMADNGLTQRWEGTCWMNPPYGRQIGEWMEKAFQSSQLGATVVCLVPARTDTKWWHEYATLGDIRYLKGRLKFGGSKNSAPFPSAIVVFRPPGEIDDEWGEL